MRLAEGFQASLRDATILLAVRGLKSTATIKARSASERADQGTCSMKYWQGLIGSIAFVKLKWPVRSNAFVARRDQPVSGKPRFVLDRT
jgi:hypothetical protein